MEKIMGKYETIFIVNTSLTDEEITAVTEKFKTLIADNGEILKVDEWGRRKLAYEIDDHKDGYYVLVEFSAPKEFPAELERIYKITDGILRSLVVRK